jgi:diaminopimelate decarboxylase
LRVFLEYGISIAEITFALKVQGFKCFNVESIPELHRINQIASGSSYEMAPISLRVNPRNVDAKTHPYISTGLKDNKFGISSGAVLSTYQLAHQLSNHWNTTGIDCHIGSQILET